MSEAIYNHALKDLGLKETPGSKSTPRIKQAIKLSASWLNEDDSKTAWCGCIRGLWGLETGTGVPKEHYRAAEWSKWGIEVPLAPHHWKKGDTIIMRRSGGNHVTLLEKVQGKFIYCLGGNQSNEVNISKYSISDVWSVRR